MSDQTHQAVEDAIAAHIADANGGALLTGYVVIATGVSPEDETGTRYSMMEPRTQPTHVSLGLVQYLSYMQRENINDEDVE